MSSSRRIRFHDRSDSTTNFSSNRRSSYLKTRLWQAHVVSVCNTFTHTAALLSTCRRAEVCVGKSISRELSTRAFRVFAGEVYRVTLNFTRSAGTVYRHRVTVPGVTCGDPAWNFRADAAERDKEMRRLASSTEGRSTWSN